MSLLPSPAALRRRAGRGVTAVARRVLGITAEPRDALTKVPDDLPRDTLFRQPLVATASVLGDPEVADDGQVTVTFRVLVRDADAKRCPDLHVEARVTGPERSAVGETTTDMLGAARFKMTGAAGIYSIDVLEVAALALDWDTDASTTNASVDAG